MFVKVCGITKPEQIDWAIELGYSAAGVVLHPESARYCEMSRAADAGPLRPGQNIDRRRRAHIFRGRPCR